MDQKAPGVSLDTCLQITEAGRQRFKRLDTHYLLRSIIERSIIGKAVFSILSRMDSGDVMTAKQLIDFREQEHKEHKLEGVSLMGPAALFAGEKASQRVTHRAIRRCVRRGYLAVTVTVDM